MSWLKLFQRTSPLMNSVCRREFSTSKCLANFNLKGVHEPEYLDYLKPQIPFYKFINIQIKGYDYTVLESYGSYLHRLSNKLGLTVSKYWCMAPTTTKIENLKHESNVVHCDFEVNVYERNVQIQNISGRLSAILVDIVSRSLPVGVELSIHEHDPAIHESSRFIEDTDLMDYKAQLRLLRANHQDDEEEEVALKKKK